MTTYIQTYIHTYIHMYIHTYIHTYIHMYIHSPVSPVPLLPSLLRKGAWDGDKANTSEI